jgi:hypothetical protein
MNLVFLRLFHFLIISSADKSSLKVDFAICQQSSMKGEKGRKYFNGISWFVRIRTKAWMFCVPQTTVTGMPEFRVIAAT